MILILDDTFEERKADYPLSYLIDTKYRNIIEIVTHIKGNEINSLEKRVKISTCVACHRTIKFYGNSGNFLAREQNNRFFEKIEYFINIHKKPYISFSGSNNQTKELSASNLIINKRQFYYNLQGFLDYYLDNNEVEFKTLIYGKNWLGYDLAIIQSNIYYILNNHSNWRFLSEFQQKDTKLFSELQRFNQVASLFATAEEWEQYIIKEFNEICDLRSFLERIVKSYLKYGKYIYNL
ncbi:hypothetical protein [Runella zeae]|uniref:hypothetical protein n=1 Tax=Runella zeae TaxID=94255 RepID=UPI002357302C|nr:hypothetical protein [Runella zeae]